MIKDSRDAYRMLRATEQLTWTAKLDRFKRGCDDTRASKRGCDQEQSPWQNFSGSHLSSKVIFSKPIDRPWHSHNAQCQGSILSASQVPCVDRQLRIIVECEEDFNFSSGNALGGLGNRAASSQLAFSSQPTSHLILLDVDLVRINKAYFQTEHRLKAVVVRRQDKCVLIRMLDEHESSKARRAQLEFSKQEDAETFLSLIEPDSTLLAEGRSVPVKQDKGKSKEMAEVIVSANNQGVTREPYRTAEVNNDVALDVSKPENQGQSLGEKLLQLQQSRLGQPLAGPSTGGSFPLHSQGQDWNAQTPTACCSCCVHAERAENSNNNSTFTPTTEYSTAEFGSSLDNLVGVYQGQGQVSTPFTEPMELTELTDVGEMHGKEEEDVDDGLYGWPDASAVECIIDDICSLCLRDSHLEWVIARCVDQHLQGSEDRPSVYSQ
ncbi:hypothetical protein EX895_004826 [Sporisorium graminicola]|uniref:Uncharacterized protein n=1 Tax=Sporisorium graminicola TaxID=280036 RepID=A0A4U7KNS7_9BASI|nr:hypothetical protein EX895_004826 [Sporisorium graminicola]TKY86001.1 hypothetical protein EX895_004826 [Sporisorium graminicola]